MIEKDAVSATYKFYHQINGLLLRESNGQLIPINGTDDYLAMHDIDKLGRAIQEESRHGREPAGFVIERGELGVLVPRPNILASRHYSTVAMLASHHEDLDRYNGSPYVWAVSEAVRAPEMNLKAFVPDYLARYLRDGYWARNNRQVDTGTAEAFNTLFGKISENLGSTEFARRSKSHRRGVTRNVKSALAVEQKAFRDPGQRYVLMLRLGFNERYQREPMLKEIKRCRGDLLNNRRSNTLLRGIVGYIWWLHDGEMTGLQLHLIIIYAPQSSTDTIASQIGEYWKNNITDGNGTYWFCTAYMASRTNDGYLTGVGEIDRDDDLARAALRGLLCRMVEAQQVMKMKCNDRSHLFGTSQDEEKAG
jgi:hypothetical protein